MKKIVAIGGGTGLSTLLRGIRTYPADITAVVTMTDDGASSGSLRKDLGILPPGDIRKCIAALSEDESLLIDLFQYRFKRGIGLKGHSLGNILIGALKEMTGSFETAVEGTSRLLKINGKVFPASLSDVHLIAEFENGKVIEGESKITKYGYANKIKKINLTKKIKANPKVLNAIEQADLILIGPGSFYTSIIPNFLIGEILKTYQQSNAIKVFICNVSTERGETEGFTVEDHLDVLSDHGIEVDKVLINSNIFKDNSGDGFLNPVLAKGNCDKYVFTNLVDVKNMLYHDETKLSNEIWKIVLKLNKLIKQLR